MHVGMGMGQDATVIRRLEHEISRPRRAPFASGSSPATRALARVSGRDPTAAARAVRLWGVAMDQCEGMAEE